MDGIMERLFYHLKRFGGFKPIFITTQVLLTYINEFEKKFLTIEY